MGVGELQTSHERLLCSPPKAESADVVRVTGFHSELGCSRVAVVFAKAGV